MRTHAGLLRYLSLVVVVGLLSLVASYDVLTSDAWFWAFGAKSVAPGVYRNLGGGLEGVRLILLCLVFYVILTSLFPAELRYAWGRSTFPKRLLRPTGSWISRLGWLLWVGGGLFVVVFHVWLAPLDLQQRFTAAFAGGPELAAVPAVRRYLLPYLLYLPYAVCTYMLLAVPLLLLMVIAIRHDRRKLSNLLRHVDAEDGGTTEARALRLRAKIGYVYGNLRRVMNRYGWVLLLLAVYYVIEFFTPMFDTLSCMAQVSTSWGAWLFALVIVPYFFVRTYGRFHRGSRTIRRALADLMRRALADDDKDGVEQVEKTEEQVKPASLFGYLALFRQTTVVLTAGALVALGIVGTILKPHLEKERIRETVNRALPVPLDYGALLLFDLFSQVETSGQDHQYHACFEADKRGLPAEVARRFPPAGD